MNDKRTFQQLLDATRIVTAVLALLLVATRSFAEVKAEADVAEFPPELVDWVASPANPVFTAGGAGQWDVRIRERGWILREQDSYHLWYTGYDGTREGIKQLGYATSADGVEWTRSAKNPLCRDHWIEDMMVVKNGDTNYMFAEGAAGGHTELLTSQDHVNWKWEGSLEIRMADGQRDVETPCGTPTVWIENGKWHLFYERHDLGVWLATSTDPLSGVWTNVQDQPVLVPGPAEYDKQLIALDQIISYDGAYFAFYHACGPEMPRVWNTNIARSTNLVHWQKFSGNPIIGDNKSSGIVVPDGSRFRLYTMHDQIELFYPRTNKLSVIKAPRIMPVANGANAR